MKIPVLIKVYADFECIDQLQPEVLFKQHPIAVGYYIIQPFRTQPKTSCQEWSVDHR